MLFLPLKDHNINNFIFNRNHHMKNNALLSAPRNFFFSFSFCLKTSRKEQKVRFGGYSVAGKSVWEKKNVAKNLKIASSKTRNIACATLYFFVKVFMDIKIDKNKK